MNFSTGAKIGAGAAAITGLGLGSVILAQTGNNSNSHIEKAADVIVGLGSLAAGGASAFAAYKFHRNGDTMNAMFRNVKAEANKPKNYAPEEVMRAFCK